MKKKNDQVVLPLVTSYQKYVKKLDDFEKENAKVIKRHFELQEQKARARFTLEQKIITAIESGGVDQFTHIENKDISVRVYPTTKEVKVYENKLYKKRK